MPYRWTILNNKFYKLLIIGAFINLIIFIGIYLWNQGKHSLNSLLVVRPYLEKLSYIEVKNGVKYWQLIAKKAISHKDEILLEKVNVNFFKKFSLKGDTGVFNPNTKDIKIEGHVNLLQAKGYSLCTDYLEYSHHSGLIFTDAPVVIKGKDIKLSGSGMRYFLKQGKLTLSKVKTYIYQPEEII